MEQLGILIGTVIGAALKQCAPQIIEIGRAIMRSTVEESNAPKSVVDDINARIINARFDSADRMLRNKDGDRAPRRPDGGPQDH